LADCNEAIRLAPDLAAAFDSRALTYLKMGRWDEAVADYNSALRLSPSRASSLYGRGPAKLKSGHKPDAMADLSAAAAINPKVRDDFARYGIN
jgi:tetratricopeptide (TPR) repeat protein